MDEIATTEHTPQNKNIYSYKFRSFHWNVKYEVEVYAGSSQGVGKPFFYSLQTKERKWKKLELQTRVSCMHVCTGFCRNSNCILSNITVSWYSGSLG